MTTIKDVAREAGVSLGTVSNVLNGRESVKPENREKVLKAIKKLRFHYNMTARAGRFKSEPPEEPGASSENGGSSVLSIISI